MYLTTLLFLILFSSINNIYTDAFVPAARVSIHSPGKLWAGPLFKGPEYEQTVENLMYTKSMTREEAEKDYNSYLENPNNYALGKGEEYYKGLGYKSLMDGVIGEAEKEGRGAEVRDRIRDFKKQSQLKAFAVLGVVFVSFFYWKIQYVPEVF